MRLSNYQAGSNFYLWLFVAFMIPAHVCAEIKTWTGYGGDSNWSNPLNWSGAILPMSSDDILFDNRDLPVSYIVTLPNEAVIIRTLHINPSPGRNIEVILPATNQNTEALTVTGPGYGIELNAGAIFRNASGLASGESMRIGDSIAIHDGGRYIHQTRASHANNILALLSTAAGTEQGIFDFDVPRASYTISVSNRTYGSLELHSNTLGAKVNYTCSGSNMLHVRGNLRIGENVNLSLDLSGLNGNIQVDGDLIQEGGQLNLSSGNGDNTVLRISGDLYQAITGIITETANGTPFLELNGKRLQEIAMAGLIQNQVGFRIDNSSGAALRLPLTLPYQLALAKGSIFSATTTLLTLGENCNIQVDSSATPGSYIDGPLRKLNLSGDHFLFPVGKQGILRWLELKNPSGNYTVEYFRQNPSFIGSTIGTGLDHISKIEYWTAFADGNTNAQTKIELSFAYNQSGGVTDPNYLNVAGFYATRWEDAGHTATTGNYLQGSVVSLNLDPATNFYTIASSMNFANPLPAVTINLRVQAVNDKAEFSWEFECPEKADHFDLFEETGAIPIRIAKINAIEQQYKYCLTTSGILKNGNQYFRIKMTDVHGIEYAGKIVQLKKDNSNAELSWVMEYGSSNSGRVLVRSEKKDELKYEIFSFSGKSVRQGVFIVGNGKNYLNIESESLAVGMYIFRAIDQSGNTHFLSFLKN